MKIAIISDTHNFIDELLVSWLKQCDEIWHAGDIGSYQTYEKLKKIKPLKAVYGNIDGPDLNKLLPEYQIFEAEGVSVFMTHIGGYPGRYNKRVKVILESKPPDIFISGHSHILKVMPDNKLNLLHINPGAAGRFGLQHVRTIVTIEVADREIKDIKAIELGIPNSF